MTGSKRESKRSSQSTTSACGSIESEFANVLGQTKREGNTLSAALRDVWDGISIRPATKTSRVWASDPHIALSGAVTPANCARCWRRAN